MVILMLISVRDIDTIMDLFKTNVYLINNPKRLMSFMNFVTQIVSDPPFQDGRILGGALIANMIRYILSVEKDEEIMNNILKFYGGVVINLDLPCFIHKIDIGKNDFLI